MFYLYRDPRDVLVSPTKDHVIREIHPGKAEKQVMLDLLVAEIPRRIAIARDWLAQDKKRVLPITFDAMKQDTAATIRRCLSFAGLSVREERLAEAIDTHSFERVTGYMLRKGISGEWRNYFDAEVTMTFSASVGESVVNLGFEPNGDWLRRHMEDILAAR